MIVQISAATDPGLTRNNNEDSVAFDDTTGLCILADGMGGHNAGEVASGMATAFIESELSTWLSHAGKNIDAIDLEETLAHCVTMANSAIYNMSRANVHYSGMGTTLVVGVFREDSLVLGHIGDSRCYRFRANQLQQITKDHSVHQEQIDSGLVMPDQGALIHQNMLTRALGVDDYVPTEINHYKIERGDLYLMCSDGLSDMIGEEEIASILLGSDALEEKTKQLIWAANASGGRDNISVLLAQVVEAPKNRLLSSARRAILGVWPGLLRA